jgi:hypothetical protein
MICAKVEIAATTQPGRSIVPLAKIPIGQNVPIADR